MGMIECDNNRTLHVEQVSRDRYFDFYTIEGFTVEEMDYIIKGNGDGVEMNDRFVNVMSKYRNDSWYGKNVAEAWRWGYGIYSIKHIGGHLLIEVGNSCD